MRARKPIDHDPAMPYLFRHLPLQRVFPEHGSQYFGSGSPDRSYLRPSLGAPGRYATDSKGVTETDMVDIICCGKQDMHEAWTAVVGPDISSNLQFTG